MAPTIYVSKNGFASCPSCLSHIRLDADRDETVCPFCEEKLTVAAHSAQIGGGAMGILRNSRSGILAAALAGAGLSLTMACGDPDPDSEQVAQADVGADVGFSTTEEDDTGTTSGADDTGADDAGAPSDTEPPGDDVNYEPNPQEPIEADYGGFPEEEEPNFWEEEPPLDAGVEEDTGEGATDVGEAEFDAGETDADFEESDVETDAGEESDMDAGASDV